MGNRLLQLAVGADKFALKKRSDTHCIVCFGKKDGAPFPTDGRKQLFAKHLRFRECNAADTADGKCPQN
jgi:hypothetical protein